MDQLNAALAGRYVIDRELGHGGMATVYLARDLKHERFVALKTLRPEIAAALGSERFLREIKLAARLQHPNILAVYDSGDAAGTLYYVMPYVEGESLRDRLGREIQLPLEDALRIATEVADALGYAHEHDVVHRDIKPENIMLSGGHAIVADFGIARAISAAGGDKLTETGIAIGTPTYMSPEQSAGTGQVDRRSDIYSLGCVLYETLAGQPPFTGPTAQAIIARHSLDSVPRLRVVREAIPDALEAVIKRALAKVPADRYQTAAQLVEALQTASTGRVSRVSGPSRARRWTRVAAIGGVAAFALVIWAVFQGIGRPGAVAAAGLDPGRIAVMYFDDLSRDSSLGHLADGLTEGLIAELAPVRGLEVVSANGVAPYRGDGISRDSVAKLLGAGTIVEGSVEPLGQRLRVATRLVDGTSGVDIRRESFDLPAADVLAIRDSLVRRIALALRERVGVEVRTREQRAGTRSVDAWTLVQRAERLRKEAQEQAREDVAAGLGRLRVADSLLGIAMQVDADWVEPLLGRAWLGFEGALMARGRTAERQEWIATGLLQGAAAVAMAPREPRALEARGTLRYVEALFTPELSATQRERKLDEAQSDLEAAVRENPGLAAAHAMLSFLYHDRKDEVSAVLAGRKAYEADAYLRNADLILYRLFSGSYNLSQFLEARRWCAEGARRFPNDHRFVTCGLLMLLAPDARPDVADAWRLAARLDTVAPAQRGELVRRVGHMIVGGVIGRAGLTDSADRVLRRARAEHDVDPTQELLGYEAVMRTLMGEADTAIGLLKRYVAANPSHSFQAGGNIHWWWRDLRTHPEFADLLGLAH